MMQGPATTKDETRPEVLTPALAPAPAVSISSDTSDASETEVISSIKPRCEEERIHVTDPSDPEPHRQKVTLWLIGLLAGLVFVHYACMVYLDWNGKKLEHISNAFNATLPVIAGLAGAAVTYYFTHHSNK